MAQKYDKIFRENLEELVIPLATKLLHLTIPALQEIPDDLQVTVERKPDFLKKVIHSDSSDDYILHFEFQSTDDAEMAERMLEYFGMLYRKYQIPIKQYVFYIGDGRSQMNYQIIQENLAFRYVLISASEIDYRIFLQATSPEEVLLSILGNFQSDSSEQVIERILTQLRNLEARPRRLARYIKQLEVLAKLRNLQKLTILISEKMALTYDLETDIRYQQGEEKGVKTMIQHLLKQGILTIEQIAEAAAVSVAEVQRIAKSQR